MTDKRRLHEIIGDLYAKNVELTDEKEYWYNRYIEQRDKERENREAVPLSGIIREGEA